MSHHRKLFRTALITTAAIALAASLGGCAPLLALAAVPVPAPTLHRDAAEVSDDLTFARGAELPSKAYPGFATSLLRDPDWVADQENSVSGKFILNSTPTGCQLSFYQNDLPGLNAAGDSDLHNTVALAGEFLGVPVLETDTGRVFLRSTDIDGKVEALAIVMNINDEQSIYVAARVFTKAEVRLVASLTCFDGLSAETVWNQDVASNISVSLYPNA